ncbi:MAG TPA: hypothetical protein VEY51_11400 [Chondromyces sp.]|nr:hypothetical protein [Chondromyces sp.]
MTVPKGYLEEIFGVSLRARRKECEKDTDPFISPIIHRQIHGDEIYQPLKRMMWNN